MNELKTFLFSIYAPPLKLSAMHTTARTRRLDSVVLKAAMAISGALMVVWLTLHMLGNLTMFAGAELMNEYAVKVRATGLLWPVRAGLVLAFIVHVVCALLTSRRSWAARPRHYQVGLRHRTSSAAGRSMRLTGVLLGLYVAYHVAQMYGCGHPAFIAGDVHHNLVHVLRLPWHLGLYLAATALVCLHLGHGLRSSLQSLGVVTGNRERLVRRALYAWALVVTLGFALESLAPLLEHRI